MLFKRKSEFESYISGKNVGRLFLWKIKINPNKNNKKK